MFDVWNTCFSSCSSHHSLVENKWEWNLTHVKLYLTQTYFLFLFCMPVQPCGIIWFPSSDLFLQYLLNSNRKCSRILGTRWNVYRLVNLRNQTKQYRVRLPNPVSLNQSGIARLFSAQQLHDKLLLAQRFKTFNTDHKDYFHCQYWSNGHLFVLNPLRQTTRDQHVTASRPQFLSHLNTSILCLLCYLSTRLTLEIIYLKKIVYIYIYINPTFKKLLFHECV